MKKILCVGVALAISLLVISCASSNAGASSSQKTVQSSARAGKSSKAKKIKIKDDEYLQRLDEGEYESIIAFLEQRNAKKPGNQFIRDEFEIAMLRHLQKEYDESARLFEITDNAMADAVTKSITKGIAAATLNDNNAEYAGHPYEYIYLNIINALNYLGKGDIDEAAVEVRKLNDKQRQYLAKYGELLLAQDDDAVEDAAEGGASGDKKTSSAAAYEMLHIERNAFLAPEKLSKAEKQRIVFRDSPAGRYLSMVFYLMDGDDGNAALDARTLKALNASFDTSADLSVPRGKGRLDVLALTNFIARRDEQRQQYGPFGGFAMRVSSQDIIVPKFDIEVAYPRVPTADQPIIPVAEEFATSGSKYVVTAAQKAIRPLAPSSVRAVKIVMGDGREFALPVLEYLTNAVVNDVRLGARQAYNRSLTRTIVKKSAAVSAGTASIAAAQNSNQLLAIIAAMTASKAIDMVDLSETADIRQVCALPGEFRAGGITLDPGTYSFKVQFLGNTGADGKPALLYEESFSDVQVVANRPTLVESVYTN